MSFAPTLPAGWLYEGADWSVGITGEIVWHNDCTKGSADALLIRSDEARDLYLCPDCGAVATAVRTV